MPARKTQQSSAMLYTVVAFVGLFIVATTVAVIYYMESEEQRTAAADSESKLEEVFGPSEQQKGLAKIVGTIPPDKSGLGMMVEHLNAIVSKIIGGPLEDSSAEAKVKKADMEFNDSLRLAQQHIDARSIDPNTTGLVQVIRKLKTELDTVRSIALATQQRLDEQQKRYDQAMIATGKKEDELIAEKEEYEQQVIDIKQKYDELELLLRTTTDEQVQTLADKLKEQEDNYNKEHQDKLKIEAELKMAQDRIEHLQKQIQAIMPPPDPNVAAYEPDGRIVLIDNQTKIVHLDKGIEDRLYRGLTLSVYDKNMPIPKDGKGKAEIEVFSVGKTISAARIIPSQTNKPILVDDIVANLIWDSHRTNMFVVAGDFDLDSDGNIDNDGANKIKTLIEKWGGKTADAVAINTDFVVLGGPPQVLKKPTPEEIEVYPLAMEKYQASLQRLDHYKEIESRAQALSIPIFNAERFLYFVGYKGQAGRAGAF